MLGISTVRLRHQGVRLANAHTAPTDSPAFLKIPNKPEGSLLEELLSKADQRGS